MDEIRIGFSTHKGGLLSALIKWVQGTKYSHVYIRRASKYGEFVYQASGLAVNFMSLETFLEKNVIVEEYAFDLNDDAKEAMMRFFIKYAGRPYALKNLFQILGIILGKRLGMKVKFKGDGDKTFVCSELGDMFCRVVLRLDVPAEQDFVDPKEINKYVSAAGRKVV